MGYAVNSGIGTKACVYDFVKDGPLGPTVFNYSGISFKPGEAILDLRFTRLDNFASPGGGAVTFSFGWGAGAFFTPFYTNTLASQNAGLLALFQSAGVNKKFSDVNNARIPFNSSVSLPMNFTSSDVLTSGKVAFIITYVFTRF